VSTPAPVTGDSPWWQAAVVYQIYPRSFADSNGDGVGDLTGIRAHLDHLVELGVDALWLSPVFRSPMHDFGYDIADHTAIDPVFGTLDDADRLIQAAHDRGLRVLFDIVLGHTSDEHPWFRSSASGRDAPCRDFYVWRDGPTPGSAEGGPPNNWTAGFPAGAAAWTWHESTGQWYLHSHLPQQPDLDWTNPAVQDAQEQVLRFWLDRGIDGVRLDSINRLGKDPQLRDNVPDEPTRSHDWPVLHQYLRRVRQVLDDYPDRVAVGEVWLFDQRQLMPYLAPDELHLAHNFVFARLPFDADAFRRTIAEFTQLAEFAGTPAWPAWFLNNHDEPRTVTRFGSLRAARLAALMLLTLRGTPFLYQGEELGLPDTSLPDGVGADRDGRDPQRTPLPWQPPSIAGPGAGFTSGTPWLPMEPTAEVLNVATQRADPTSTLALYRELLRLRRTRPSLTRGAQNLLELDPHVLAYRRSTSHENTLVLLNFANDPVTLDLRQHLSHDEPVLALSSLPPFRTPATAQLPQSVDPRHFTLRPNEGVLLLDD
jgi:alpha-glucosidase